MLRIFPTQTSVASAADSRRRCARPAAHSWPAHLVLLMMGEALRDRVRPGVIFALYLVCSGLERFLVEFIRRNHEVLAGLTAPQLESLVLIAVGLTWLVAMSGFCMATVCTWAPVQAV